MYKISGTHFRCKQQEMTSVIATWKYRKRNETFTCNKKSQGSLGIASYVKVTASSSFVGDSHTQLFCFLEQLLASFDVCHVTILFIFLWLLFPGHILYMCTVLWNKALDPWKEISFSFSSASGNGRFICTEHCLNSHWVKFTKWHHYAKPASILLSWLAHIRRKWRGK